MAIGRAIAREPALFLFDEPLSNLDAKLRVEMRTQIKRLHMAFSATSVYVTHDQTEAMTLADRIVALRDGRIEQVGSPDDLYARPANRFVAGFIGSPTMNFLPARLERGRRRPLRRAGRRPPPAGPALARRALRGRIAGKPVVLGLRPEDLTNTWTDESRDGSGVVPLDVVVEIAEPLGSDTLVFSRIGASEIIGRLSATAAPAIGAPIRLNAHLNHMHLFDPDTGSAL